MRFLLDENISSPYVERGLRADGHEVWRVTKLGIGGFNDDKVIDTAKQMNCTLISRDIDIEKVCTPQASITAMILKDPAPQWDKHKVLALIRDLLTKYLAEIEAGKTLIWSDGSVRFC